MAELLTESFCERCGTRYTFESGAPETRRPSIKRARVLARGLKHFVLSDDSLETALAEGERDEDRERAALQLEAFHQTFNFCMDCRQYSCRDCWNETEGRCLSCAPAPGRIETTSTTWANAATDGLGRLDGLLGPGTAAPPPPITAWPLDGAADVAIDTAPAIPALSTGATSDAAETEPEAGTPEPQPVAASAEDEPAGGEPAETAGPTADEPRPQSLEDYLLATAAAQRPVDDATASAVEPVVAPEPEPQPVVASEPEPQPVVAPQPERQPVVAPQPVVAVQPPTPIFPPPVAGDAAPVPGRLPGWDMVAPDAGHRQAPPLPPVLAGREIQPAPWFAARSNASIWDASTADVVNRLGSGVQACVSCGLPLSAAAHFCRRCGARQGI